jgi:glucosamine-6-phosphate deaminase
MRVRGFATASEMSAAAADHAAASLRAVLRERGEARVAAATAASQVEFQRALVRAPDVDWPRVELFQLDDYIGLADDHPARFTKLLREHVIQPTGITRHHLLTGTDPWPASLAAGRALTGRPLDLAFLGIGENAHLAFNDPPADFENDAPYAVVELDDACRRQQVGEGWYASLSEVPRSAVSMTIREMLRAREVIVIVPDARKADAVKATLEAEISPAVPASILRTHPNATLYVDASSASKTTSGVVLRKA